MVPAIGLELFLARAVDCLGHPSRNRMFRVVEPPVDGLADVCRPAPGRLAGRTDRLGDFSPCVVDDGVSAFGNVRDDSPAGDPHLRDRRGADHVGHAAGLLLDLGGRMVVSSPAERSGWRLDRGGVIECSGCAGEVFGPGIPGIGRAVPACSARHTVVNCSDRDSGRCRCSAWGSGYPLSSSGMRSTAGRGGPTGRPSRSFRPGRVGEHLADPRLPRRGGRRTGRSLVDRRCRRDRLGVPHRGTALESDVIDGRVAALRQHAAGSRRHALPPLPLGSNLVCVPCGQHTRRDRGQLDGARVCCGRRADRTSSRRGAGARRELGLGPISRRGVAASPRLSRSITRIGSIRSSPDGFLRRRNGGQHP